MQSDITRRDTKRNRQSRILRSEVLVQVAEGVQQSKMRVRNTFEWFLSIKETVIKDERNQIPAGGDAHVPVPIPDEARPSVAIDDSTVHARLVKPDERRQRRQRGVTGGWNKTSEVER